MNENGNETSVQPGEHYPVRQPGCLPLCGGLARCSVWERLAHFLFFPISPSAVQILTALTNILSCSLCRAQRKQLKLVGDGALLGSSHGSDCLQE